jgi:hypothetical protein
LITSQPLTDALKNTWKRESWDQTRNQTSTPAPSCMHTRARLPVGLCAYARACTHKHTQTQTHRDSYTGYWPTWIGETERHKQVPQKIRVLWVRSERRHYVKCVLYVTAIAPTMQGHRRPLRCPSTQPKQMHHLLI